MDMSTKILQYFEALASDLDYLGIPCYELRNMSIDSVCQALDPGLLNVHDTIPAQDPKTRAGKQISELIKFNISLNQDLGIGYWQSCKVADNKLDASLSLREIASPGSLAPVIIIRDGGPVAVAKSRGENTVYALQTIPAVGLVSGFFNNYNSERLMPKTYGPKTEPTIVELGVYDRFYPIRLSFRALPEDIRAALKTVDSKQARLMPTDGHQKVIENVGQLVVNFR